ncbi:transcription activator effector binding [Pseudarthrobacter chlorophenolicus A6]|uniref:Transcription activator effector binding n=1 Tax=Pseudarthrobacter chlorophenolicus (strain ATCC 700700 / DSM 12829 / CIP 107037 / JCM 12360 / KCTC 9906 / NCIMB 13794 / A6) TaxID=452863 RepID=B8H9I7_PSECP|nr:GyrI-like domain-containing protein [Pseudarthrobacter chlorophenolicus]ACL40056.1 transcription activator effector binding [Pseudarthrobacter chlorophenolicus A6]SDQ88684.1 effector-binding domain-containing protein [Pseudarthrobacter chlorophenolicus]
MNNSSTNGDAGLPPRKVHLAEQPVAVVREQVRMDELPEFFGRAFASVMAAAQRQGAAPAGPPFARYHGMPGETVDVEAGFPIAGGFTTADGVEAGTLPETDALEALHSGPYDTLQHTYGAIQQQMQADGLIPADTMWEYYLSDPEKEPDPATWQTRVVWPVAGRTG